MSEWATLHQSEEVVLIEQNGEKLGKGVSSATQYYLLKTCNEMHARPTGRSVESCEGSPAPAFR